MDEQHEERAEAVSPQARERVKLRHPHTGDVQEVDADPEAIVPLMGLGYQQYKGD